MPDVKAHAATPCVLAIDWSPITSLRPTVDTSTWCRAQLDRTVSSALDYDIKASLTMTASFFEFMKARRGDWHPFQGFSAVKNGPFLTVFHHAYVVQYIVENNVDISMPVEQGLTIFNVRRRNTSKRRQKFLLLGTKGLLKSKKTTKISAFWAQRVHSVKSILSTHIDNEPQYALTCYAENNSSQDW